MVLGRGAGTGRCRFVFSVLLGAAIRRSLASVFEGQLPADVNFALFVGKFCFDFSQEKERADLRTTRPVGNVSIELEVVGGGGFPKAGSLEFMLFSDQSVHWRSARKRWDSTGCAEKRATASHVSVLGKRGRRQVSVEIREHLKARYWYFAIVSCGMDLMDAPSVRYHVHAVNLLESTSEFSVDRRGLLQVHAAFAFAFAVGGVALVAATRCRSAQEGLPFHRHPYVQLLLLAFGTAAAGCGFQLIHYVLFVNNGAGSMRLRFLGLLASIMSNCTLCLIALLASHGWAITTGKLDNRSFFFVAVVALGGVGAWCELRAELEVDDSTQIAAQAGTIGCIALAAKLFIFCWFAFQVRMSYFEASKPELRAFFRRLGLGVGAWALNVPVVVLLSTVVAPTYRYGVVTAVDVAMRFVGLCVLSVLLCSRTLSPMSEANTFLNLS